MSKLTLVFPIAAIAFVILTFSEYVPLLKRPTERLFVSDRRFMRRDAAAVLIITGVYAVAAFLNLGINSAPQSFCKFGDRGEYALIELNEPADIGGVMYYTGLYSGSYYIQFSSDGESWTDDVEMEQSHADLFKWREAELGETQKNVGFVRIIAGSKLWMGELALYTGEGEMISANGMAYPDGCAPLFDEQELVPEEGPTYLNGTYFDEIYHARTAYENVENVYPYEVSHPPLGKLIISVGIRLFGMTPFGWRFMGVLFGILMLPVMYVFLKKMFGGTEVPACCTAIFAFDFMHFVQTRIATIDTYAVFFILLMYLFMYIYLQADKGEDSPKRGWITPLALSGLSFGLGAASKWTCLYAGAGLGLIWLIERISRALSLKKDGRGGEYVRETVDNVLLCLVFFVAVPCLVYYLSYYPYGKAQGMSGISMYFSRDYLDIVLDNQKFMFSYHSGVTATHPYSSRWWQWLLDIRPILYYLKYFDDGTKSSFGAFVNPLLCWGGLMAMLFMAYLAAFRRDKKAGFILLGYLAQLVPWVFITRVTFEYHYFPATVFLVLALGHAFTTVRERHPGWRRIIFGYTAVCLALFAVFYPVLSGAAVSTDYSNGFLRWIPECWPF